MGVYMYVYTCLPQHTFRDSGRQFVGVFLSPSVVWGPQIKLRSSDFSTSTFSC